MPIKEILTLGLVVLSTVVLVAGWLRPDLVAILLMVILGVSRLVTPEQAFAGFSGQTVIILLAISIIAEALLKTGISTRLGKWLRNISGDDERRSILIIALTGAFLSLFMNNIAALGVLLPAAMGLSRSSRIPPSRILMPLAFGVIAGGMATLFTTSNLITSAALSDAGFKPFGILDFLPVGLPLVLITALYLYLFAGKLLPKRNPANQAEAFHKARDEMLKVYQLEPSLWEILVLPGSGMAGISIKEGDWRKKVRLTVIGVSRQGRFIASPGSDFQIKEGDVPLTQGILDQSSLDYYGLKLQNDKPLPSGLADDESSLAEIALSPHSNFEGKTLRQIRFREKYNLSVLSIWRSGQPVHIGFADLPLKMGDGLLVQGSRSSMEILSKEKDFIFLEEDLEDISHPRQARLAAAISLVTLAIGLTGWYPVSLVALAGAVLLILTGCLKLDEAYSSINWKAIFLIAGFWPLSTAITSSGLGQQLVTTFLNLTSRSSPLLVVSLILFVTMVLTNIMAGQAATPIILAPIGLAIAKSTGLDPRLLLMTIALGCSLGFLTPLGHPVNVIILGSGGYTSRDFLKIGAPLTLVLFLAILIGLHLFWGL